MKKTAILALSAAIFSCGGNRLAEAYPPTTQAIVKADTVRHKDGSRTVTLAAYAPMNEYSVTTDRRGRTKRVLARASECDVQILTFVYDRQGRISKVTESYGDLDDTEGAKVACSYRLIYNDAGSLSEIRLKSAESDESRHKGRTNAIKASEGYRLEGEIRPVADFWESDLHGGRMEIVCREVANGEKHRKLRPRIWVDFQEADEIDDIRPIGEAYLSEPKAIPFR